MHLAVAEPAGAQKGRQHSSDSLKALLRTLSRLRKPPTSLSTKCTHTFGQHAQVFSCTITFPRPFTFPKDRPQTCRDPQVSSLATVTATWSCASTLVP